MSDLSQRMDLQPQKLSEQQVKQIKELLNVKIKSALKIDETEVIVE